VVSTLLIPVTKGRLQASFSLSVAQSTLALLPTTSSKRINTRRPVWSEPPPDLIRSQITSNRIENGAASNCFRLRDLPRPHLSRRDANRITVRLRRKLLQPAVVLRRWSVPPSNHHTQTCPPTSSTDTTTGIANLGHGNGHPESISTAVNLTCSSPSLSLLTQSLC
jgi:hypothetical protein